ncbi:MAG: VWA domain-containing protein [Candidatus Pacebacteria bacterium]|nr:VWA domain-containing protein [Candidatus Paceibacterota bacterium]
MKTKEQQDTKSIGSTSSPDWSGAPVRAFATHHTHTTRGISLLIVVLIGSIMIMAATALGALALRTLKNAQTRSDAVQGTYSAEDAFACVKYWLDTNIHSFEGNPPSEVTCGNTPVPYTVDVVTGTASFSIGNTKVTVTPAADVFTVRVYAQNTGADAEKLAEKFQEYEYIPRISADILLLVDTSGSIAGDRSGSGFNATIDTAWENLIAGLSKSVKSILNKTPNPNIGVVTFGTDIYDTGKPVNASLASCNPRTTEGCLLVPSIRLTASATDLPNDDGTPNDPTDDTADIPSYPNLPRTVTNLSLALGIAGAELMGKAYYASSGSSSLYPSFEEIVANDTDLDNLADLPSSITVNRTDVPHWIIVITDGEPNAIISHVPSTLHASAQDLGTGVFISLQPTLYNPGMTKIFRTTVAGVGVMVSEDAYQTCDDSSGLRPNFGTILTSPNKVLVNKPGVDTGYGGTPNTGVFSRVPMCNATRIADKLKASVASGGADIVIGAIGVGLTPGGSAEQWLEQDFVTDDLYKAVGNYSNLVDAIDFLASKMSRLQSI